MTMLLFYGGLALFIWALTMNWAVALVAGVGMFFFMSAVNVTGRSMLRDKVLLWKKGEEQ